MTKPLPSQLSYSTVSHPVVSYRSASTSYKPILQPIGRVLGSRTNQPKRKFNGGGGERGGGRGDAFASCPGRFKFLVSFFFFFSCSLPAGGGSRAHRRRHRPRDRGGWSDGDVIERGFCFRCFGFPRVSVLRCRRGTREKFFWHTRRGEEGSRDGGRDGAGEPACLALPCLLSIKHLSRQVPKWHTVQWTSGAR